MDRPADRVFIKDGLNFVSGVVRDHMDDTTHDPEFVHHLGTHTRVDLQ